MLPYIIRFLPVIIIIIAICVIIFTLIYRKKYNTQGKAVFNNWYYYLIFGIMIICMLLFLFISITPFIIIFYLICIVKPL